jgi:putative transposase
MKKKKRQWSYETKLAILREAEVYGIAQTLRKWEVSSGVFYRWRDKFEQEGEAGLRHKKTKRDPEFKAYELENKRLRQIIADQALELKIKEELLKKTLPPDNSDG